MSGVTKDNTAIRRISVVTSEHVLLHVHEVVKLHRLEHGQGEVSLKSELESS